MQLKVGLKYHPNNACKAQEIVCTGTPTEFKHCCIEILYNDGDIRQAVMKGKERIKRKTTLSCLEGIWCDSSHLMIYDDDNEKKNSGGKKAAVR